MAVGSNPDLEIFEKECCVRGYHEYQAIWDAAIDEELPCEHEVHNTMDHYAVAVVKDGQIVGHLPKKISRICSLFLRRGGGGTITIKVTGHRRYSSDLEQGGMEIPCLLLLSRRTQRNKKNLSSFSLTKLFLVCLLLMSSKNYSETSDKGPSQKRTTSQKKTQV